MERLLNLTVACVFTVVGFLSQAVAQDATCPDTLSFDKSVDCNVELIKNDIMKSTGSDQEKAEAVKTLEKASTVIKGFGGKLGEISQVAVVYELLKMVVDLGEQSDNLGDGTGCRNFYVYMFSKDINVYSKYWLPKSKLDNGTGLKHNGAIERTLGIFTVPTDSEGQLRSKEYFGMVDRKLVEVKNDELTYVNDDLVVVIPGEETGCQK